MDEMISRMAAIEAIEKHIRTAEEPYQLTDADKVMNHAFEIAASCVYNLPSAQPKQPEQRWIPCSERMPEEGERVLATHLGGVNPNNQVIEHIYQHGEFTCGWDMDMNVDSPTFGQRYMGEVIAWMPLPEPYKEDDHD